MADPIIPNVPASIPSDQAAFFQKIKTSIEYLMGQGRNLDETRALRVNELESLGIDVNSFLNSSSSDPYLLNEPTSTTGAIPDPPSDLVVTKGAFVHTLTWTNPTDPIVWYIEIWVADNSQSRDDADLVGIYTVISSTRGKTGSYRYSGFDLANDQTYWIRSRSYGYRYSVWSPPDSQGGYVVPGDDTVQETVTKVLEILQGEITESQLYQELNSRIDLIDTSGTGLVDRISSLESNIDSMPAWATGTAYFVDDVVLYNDKIYICILNTVSPHAEPPTNTTYWEKIGESASLAGNISANATAISNLDARVEDNEGDISSQSTLIAGLRSDVDDNVSAIASEQTTRANADSSLASEIITGIATAKSYTEGWADEGADVTANSAAFQAEQIARADGDSANAQSINTVQTTVDGHTTAIQTNLTSINGIEGKYSVKIDNNGYVSGFGLISESNNGTPTSEFILLVDSFKVVTPGETPRTPFVIGQVDGVDTIGIDGNMVIDGTLLSSSIAADSIKAAHIDTNETFVGMTIQSSNFVTGSQGWRIKSDGTMEIYGGKIIVGSGSTISGADDFPTSLSDLSSSEYSDLQTALTNSAQAIQDASAAQSTADGKITSYYQPTAPVSGMGTGDFWVDTDDGNTFYRYSGSAWVLAQDSDIATALDAAQTAQTTADGKAVVYYQTTAPTGASTGDLWYDTDDTQNRLYRYNGSSWSPVATKGATWGTDVEGQPSDDSIYNNKIENDVVRIPRPGGGSFSDTGGYTGYLKVTLPLSWSNTMMTFTVDVFNYATGTSFSLTIGGYNYIALNSWLNTTANLIGNPEGDNAVRFGYDGSKCAVYIGEADTYWSHPKVAVRDFIGGYSNYAIDQWDDGWSIEITPTLGTITSTITDALIDANSTWDRVASKPTFGVLSGLDEITDTEIGPAGISAQNINATNLAALSTVTGALYVDNAITLNAGVGKIKTVGKDSYTDSTPGFYLGMHSAGAALGIGDSSKYLRYYNGALSLGGELVATQNLVASSVSKMATVSVDQSVLSINTWSNVVSTSITLSSSTAKCLVLMSARYIGSTASYSIKVRFKRVTSGGATVYSDEPVVWAAYGDNNDGYHYATVSLHDSPGAGTHTYTFQGYQSGATKYCYEPILTVLGVEK